MSYKKHNQDQIIGVVWTEEPNMKSSYNTMSACQAVVENKSCQILYLVRAASVGSTKLMGSKIYRKIFKSTSKNRHIQPNLESVYYLATYHSLVNAALTNELVIEYNTISLKELEDKICASQIFNNCSLLQDFSVVMPADNQTKPDDIELDELK